MYNEGIKTFTAGEALAAHRRVKLDSTVGQVVYADATDLSIGVTEDAAASGAPVAVKLKNYPGTLEIEAAGVVTAGNRVYGAADGKVSETSTGNECVGIAHETASGDGAVIEVQYDSGELSA